MKRKSYKSLIKKVINDLSWPILEKTDDVPAVRVVSDVRNKTHLVFLPEKKSPENTEFSFLHELGHATLCEKVHPVFATNGQFPQLENKRQFLPLLPALQAACDWFVCHWQYQIVPQEMQQQLKENMPVVEEILGMQQLPPLDIILDASVIIAQAIHYTHEPIDCGGVLKQIVDAFLSVPPDKPSGENCVLLVNRLLSTYSDQRACLVPDDGCLVWKMVLPSEMDCDSASAGATS